MADIVLVLNAGSSSLKFALYDAGSGAQPRLLCGGQAEGIGGTPRFKAADGTGKILDEKQWPEGARAGHDDVVAFLVPWLKERFGAENRLVAVGHRVVHGGADFDRPVLVDEKALERLRLLVPLAPLHQPHNLAPIEALMRRVPGLPQVACFDTAFHRTQPEVAQAFALPRAITDKGVRRYGFHGLSYEYIASALPRIAPAIAGGRVVVAHLGNGASMCAMRAGRSVASTMGFTAVDGLPMGTRSGSVDPGVILYLLTQNGLGPKGIEKMLYNESGLLGVSGISNDMRTLLASPDPRARQAIDLFVYRIGRELGSLAAALGGLDAIVFTGGIGEHAQPIRARVCQDAGWLGVRLDEAANRADGPRISTAESRASAWVVPTDENLMIALHTRRLAAGS